MKRNLRVLQINGIRGLFFALFVLSCLIAGFVAFPAFLIMNAWNYVSNTTLVIPPVNFCEGLLLWAIIAFSAFLFTKKKFIVLFNAKQELTDDEVMEVVSKIKSQAMSSKILNDMNVAKHDLIQKIEPQKEHVEEVIDEENLVEK